MLLNTKTGQISETFSAAGSAASGTTGGAGGQSRATLA
jgi:hypothetical protein